MFDSTSTIGRWLLSGMVMPASTEGETRFERALGRYVAFPALVLLAFATFYGVGGGNTALAFLMLCTLAVAPWRWRTLASEPLLWLTVAYLAWIAWGTWELMAARPEWSAVIRETGREWALTGFLPILVTAFWLGRYPRLIRWLPALLVAGFLLRILERITLEQLADFAMGADRASFGNSATNFGLWSWIAVVAVVSLLPLARSPTRRSQAVAALSLWALALVSCIAALVFSQTRGAWLAALIAAFVGAFWWFRKRQPQFTLRRIVTVTATSVAVCSLTIGLVFSDVFSKRLDQHRDTIVSLAQGQWSDLPADPIGLRIMMYKEGIRAWVDRPLRGHGPGVGVIVLAETDNREITQRGFNDFHNTYLNILAEFGLVGAALIATLVVLLCRSARDAQRARWLPEPSVGFLLTAFVAILVAFLSNHSVPSFRAPFLYAVLGGMAYAWRFSMRDSRIAKQATADHGSTNSDAMPNAWREGA